jgi:hypothetical protein
VSSVNTVSTVPAADSVCPIIDLFEEIGIDFARSPNTDDTPRYSILSFSGVPVPCGLM